MDSLKEISKRSGAKKQYLTTFVKRYAELFEPLRKQHLNILEVGVGGYKDPNKGGGSIRMWAEYFCNSKIVGLDFHAKSLQLPTNAEIVQGSQTDVELLKSLGGFDIVIDDASHITSNTIITFESLWPITKLLYIVEDLHMAKAKGTEEYFRNIPGADFDTKNLCVITKTQQI